MEKNIGDDLTFWCCLPENAQDYLGQVRHWDNLKVGTEGGRIWVRDLNKTQIESATVQSLPFVQRFSCRDNLLFPLGSALPNQKIPLLLWTPIQRAVRVDLPNRFYDYTKVFDNKPFILPKLIPSEIEKPAFALLTSLKELGNYVEIAAAIRLKPLSWVIVETAQHIEQESQVLIVGTPILPIRGKTFWLSGDFLMPTGFAMELPILQELWQQKINFYNMYFIVWQEDSTFFRVDKLAFTPLSLASFSLSLLPPQAK